MRNTFYGIVIIILLSIILIQRECSGPSNNPKPTGDTVIVHDTIYKKIDTTIIKKIPIYKEIPAPPTPPEYLPHPEYKELKAQYVELTKKYLAKRIYKDSIAIGTYGHVKITDTVTENALLRREYTEEIVIPTIKETVTVTKPEVPKRQVYIGGGLSGSQTKGPNQITGGILYKTKTDKLYGLHVNYSLNSGITYGVSTYWKIKLKK